jgi:thioredoxin-like negative regulator of GroEL
MGEIRDITTDEFAGETAGPNPALVEFYTQGCPACARFGPTYERLAEEYAGRATLLKMDARKNLETAKQLHVRGVPTVVVFREGEELQRLTGAKTLAEMREWLAPVLP